jgi:hypothetical protein
MLTDDRGVDLDGVRDRSRAYCEAIADMVKAAEGWATSLLDQEQRREIADRAMAAACESAKDVPTLADKVQQLRDDLAASEARAPSGDARKRLARHLNMQSTASMDECLRHADNLLAVIAGRED